MTAIRQTLCVLAFFAPVVAATAGQAWYESKRSRELREYAVRSGWVVVEPAAVPWPLAAHVFAHTPALVMVLRRTGGDVWYVRHRWKRGRQRYDRTRFITAVPPSTPAIVVERRGLVGSTYQWARGTGTSDGGFDRAFSIRPADDWTARAYVRPRLRAALLAREVPPFAVYQNLLYVEYRDRTDAPTLDQRTRALLTLRDHLTGG